MRTRRIVFVPFFGIAHLEENIAAGAIQLTVAEMAEWDQRR